MKSLEERRKRQERFEALGLPHGVSVGTWVDVVPAPGKQVVHLSGHVAFPVATFHGGPVEPALRETLTSFAEELEQFAAEVREFLRSDVRSCADALEEERPEVTDHSEAWAEVEAIAKEKML